MQPRIDAIFGSLTKGAQQTTPISPMRQTAVQGPSFGANPATEGMSFPGKNNSDMIKPVVKDSVRANKLDLEG